jgi:hypothetical protein
VGAVKRHRALEVASRELRRDWVAVEVVEQHSSLEFASRSCSTTGSQWRPSSSKGRLSLLPRSCGATGVAVEAVRLMSAREFASKELQRDMGRRGRRQAAQGAWVCLQGAAALRASECF